VKEWLQDKKGKRAGIPKWLQKLYIIFSKCFPSFKEYMLKGSLRQHIIFEIVEEKAAEWFNKVGLLKKYPP